MNGYRIGEDGPATAPSNRSASPLHKLRAATRGLAEVRDHLDAAEPILTPDTRAAVFEWLAELRSERELVAAGITPRTTVLLKGPPGCGKTTLVHHVAARLGVPMVLVGPETLTNAYVGESGKNVVRLFDAVENAQAPCILFFDEIDAVAASRDALKADNTERLDMLTVLLRRIEGYRGMLVAATNRPAALDPAIWRRFGLHLEVGMPGEDERYAILARYGVPYDWRPEDLDLLCAATDGASPALLESLMHGFKRAMVLAPRMGRDISNVVEVAAGVVASLQPPPELIDVPALWRGRAAIAASLAGMAWPPNVKLTEGAA